MSAPRERPVPLVAHVIQHLIMGGLENGLVNLINRTPPGRVRHAVICLSHFSNFRARLADPEVPVIALGKRPGKDPASFLKLWQALRALRPSIVHSRNLAAIDTAPISRLAGTPVHVHGEHGWDVFDLHGREPKYRRYRRWMRPFVTQYVAVSRDIQQWLATSVGVPPRRITQIYNGVDTARFRPSELGVPAVRDLPFERGNDTVIVGTVGRMEEVKDPASLARAFSQLVAASAEMRKRVRLVMVGDGTLHEGVRRELAAAGFADIAWLPGARDDIPELLRTFDVFVLPSKNEGVSNTILEAMASGLPVIATAVGGNAELVIPETGVLVPPGDVAAMCAAIRQLIEQPQTLRALGQAARQRAMREFALDTMVERYLSLYDSLLPIHAAA
jgi:sugar transferase (PEP-CTERM/EpsH1 system associated)